MKYWHESSTEYAERLERKINQLENKINSQSNFPSTLEHYQQVAMLLNNQRYNDIAIYQNTYNQIQSQYLNIL